MSLRMIIAGYICCLLAATVGTAAIIRSGHGTKKLKFLFFGLCCLLAGILLLEGRQFLPSFLSMVLANEAFLIAFVLIHQSIAAILESSDRYLRLSAFLIGMQFVTFLYYTYSAPDLRAKILIRTVTISIQCSLSVVILFRRQNYKLRNARTIAGSILAAFVILQICRFFATMAWTPVFSSSRTDPVQAFFATFGFALGFSGIIAVIWLGMSAQRESLQRMATTDGLSGLMNRSAFDELLQRELRRSERSRELVAALLIDLDYFKEINDPYGHSTGDEVIRRVGQLLFLNSRSVDAVARYGGEEFVMLLRGMQLAQAASVAERLRTQIEAISGLPESVRVTASIGVAVKDEGDTITSLIKRSDKALYTSKRAGRNRVSAQYA